ncbi:hypothetical protein C2S51_015493 [Perilla frutescens var. frutescens]|nr:hypothetical protein C2S51_015493 [Perilla frutescens var. frutescens]
MSASPSMESSSANQTNASAYEEGRTRAIPWFEAVKSKLSPDNKDRLCQTCFGKILKIKVLRLQDELYFQLVKRLDVRSRSGNCLVFKIRDQSIEFTTSDFAVVTGLRFSPSAATSSSSVFHNLIFDGRPDLQFEDVRHLFIFECEGRGGAGEICLKLGLLVIVYRILLHNKGPSNIIDNRFIHLVDDLVSFDRFPWGRIAYDHLVQSTYASRDHLRHFISTGTRPDFDPPGYSFALQVWAYEVMPSVGRLCANRILGWESLTPRVMGWSPVEGVTKLHIEEAFTSVDLQVLAPINNLSVDKQIQFKFNLPRTPCSIMTNQPYFDSPVQQFNTGLNLIKRKLSFPDRSEGTRGKGLPKFDIGHCIAMNASDVAVCSGMKKTAIMKSVLPTRGLPKVTFSGGGTGAGPSRSRNDCRTDADKVPTLEELAIQITGLSIKVRELKDMLLNSKTNPTQTGTPFEFPISVPTQVEHILVSSSSESSFSLAPSKKKRVGARRLLLDDDNIDSGMRNQSSEVVHPMFEQFHLCLFNIPIPTLWSVGVSRPWFDTLLNLDGWLADEHMDTMLALIVIQCRLQELAQSGNRLNWAIVDTTFWGALKQADRNVLYEHTMPYVHGSRPAVGANGVTVYDSRSAKLYWPLMLDQLKDFAKNIPWLLRRLNVNVIKSGDLKRKWDVVQYKHPPQQLNDSDCRVMSLQYLKCILSGTPLSTVNPSHSLSFWKTCCGQLFEYGLNLLGERSAHVQNISG